MKNVVTSSFSEALPPALILGGEANALSVARDLGRAGVTVYAVGEADSTVRASRYVHWIDLDPAGHSFEEAWGDFLLGPQSEHLRGAVVMACSDAGIRVLIRHRQQLLARFRLDDSDPSAQLLMLDKLTTYKHARAAGVPTPGFWEISARQDLFDLRDRLAFPLMIKPRLSHLFEQRFGRKHVIVDSFDELLAAFDLASGAGMEMLLMEHIPGPDDRLCSYYTYLDEQSEPLFHFTKRIIRRFPTGMGAACYHITDRVPEIGELGNRLFKHVRLRGLANVEFKRDPRDGQYKLIECNARYTASNCLVSASGVKLATFVYNRIVERPLPDMSHFTTGLRLWDPLRDWKAFRELNRAGKLGLFRWIGGVCRRQTFAFFSWSDPMPAVSRLFKPIRRLFKSRAGKSAARTPTRQGALA